MPNISHNITMVPLGEGGYYCFPHFTEEGLRFCGGTLTCSRSHCWLTEEVQGLNFILVTLLPSEKGLRGFLAPRVLSLQTQEVPGLGTLSLEK